MGHSLLIVGPFGLGDGRQHPVGQIVIGVRLRADADLDAGELVGAEAGDDGFQAVVAAGRAVFADAELADGERNVVKEDEHPLRRDLIKVRGSLDRDAGGVHKGLRLHEKQPLAVEVRLRGEGLESLLGNLDLQARSQQVKGHETGIVTGLLVFRARIAEPRDQPVIRWLLKQHKNQNRTDMEFSS